MGKADSSIRQVVGKSFEASVNLTVTFASPVSVGRALVGAGYTPREAQVSLPIDGSAGAVRGFTTRGRPSHLVMVATGNAVLDSQGSEARLSAGGVAASVTWISEEIEVVLAQQGRIVERADFPPPTVEDLPPLIRAAWTAAGVSGGSSNDAIEVVAQLVSVDLDAQVGTPRLYEFRRVEFQVPYGLTDLKPG